MCKIPVPSRINVEFLRRNAEGFDDMAVLEFLEFGFPINYEGPPISSTREVPNYKGALDYPDHIDAYLEKEVANGNVIGPFDVCPLDDPVFSPLNSVPKKDSEDRRVINDHSFPKDPRDGPSINRGIPYRFYQGEPLLLILPTVDRLVAIVIKKGPGCLLWKRDLHAAYRNYKYDPGEVHLAGYIWKGKMYFDTVESMGGRTGAQACQRPTNLVCHISKKIDCEMVGYLDDFASADVAERAWLAFEKARVLLEACGLEESAKKAWPPSTRMPFLGLVIDTVRLTLEVPEEKLEELKKLLRDWRQASSATKKEMQSLCGLLNFVAACVPAGRVFMFRLFEFIRLAPDLGKFPLGDGARADIQWWCTYLPLFNGVGLIPEPNWSKPDAYFSVDACLAGAGGMCGREYFHCPIPSQLQGVDINTLELRTLLVALRLWAPRLAGCRVQVFCDNWATVVTLNSGKASSPQFQAAHREIFLLLARHQVLLRVKHVRSEANRAADLLSRWHLDPNNERQFRREYGHLHPRRIDVDASLFNYSVNWLVNADAIQ